MTISCERLPGMGDGVLADGDGVGPLPPGRRPFAVDGDAELLAERLELLDGGRALQVGGDQQRLLAEAGRAASWPACRRSSFCRCLAGRTA